jgi:creatinine amidohydrolase/Fe(II)-dependent formamide hydrolase-like protein
MTNSLRSGLLLVLLLAARAACAASVQLEDLTWTELRDRIAAGSTTVLVPIGGTEQSGPHMALGKHNVRVRVLAARIAERLGNALVAPVLAYVPEGSLEPPTEHMKWPGTISVPPAVFEATLEAATRSLRRAGFCQVVLLGDHGGYRASLDHVASRMNKFGGTCRVHALPEYYRAASTDFNQALAAQGHAAAEIGAHAGLADTALMLAADPSLVRLDALAAPRAGDGVNGDPRRATAALGRPGLDHIVEAAVAAIRAAAPRKP